MKNNIKFDKNLNNKPLEFDIPSSKSYTNRALIIASMIKDRIKLKNILLSEDTLLMINGLKEIGIKFKINKNDIEIFNSIFDCEFKKQNIYMGFAGTVYRFLLALTALGKGEIKFSGEPELMRRPIQELLDGLENLGLNYNNDEKSIELNSTGNITSNKIKIDPSKSSQFLSALLLIGPGVKNGLEIVCSDKIVSKTYIDLTISIMSEFGIEIENYNYQRFIAPEKNYTCKNDYFIEGDYSSASYFAAVPLLTGNSVKLNYLKKDSEQGDSKFLDVLVKMGADVRYLDNQVEISSCEKSFDNLNEIDMSMMQDVVPTLAILSIFGKGPIRISNIKNLRYKETDRIESVFNELKKMNVDIQVGEDFMLINPGNNYMETIIETYNDHRMAMAFSLAGLKIKGMQIKNPECVSKTFPDFFSMWSKFFNKPLINKSVKSDMFLEMAEKLGI